MPKKEEKMDLHIKIAKSKKKAFDLHGNEFYFGEDGEGQLFGFKEGTEQYNITWNLVELSQKLLYYNAKSVFFQGISRGKDPLGEKESSVRCFGLNHMQVKALLNFDITVPNIIKE